MRARRMRVSACTFEGWTIVRRPSALSLHQRRTSSLMQQAINLEVASRDTWAPLSYSPYGRHFAICHGQLGLTAQCHHTVGVSLGYPLLSALARFVKWSIIGRQGHMRDIEGDLRRIQCPGQRLCIDYVWDAALAYSNAPCLFHPSVPRIFGVSRNIE